jgi:putative hydrolase of the HAD superfamily
VSATRAVLLDLYDTLVWSEWPALRRELEDGLGVSTEDLFRAYTLTRPARSVGAYGSAEGDVAAVIEAAGARADERRVRELTRRMREFLETGVSLHEDSLPAVRELRDRGIRTAVVSNCDHLTRPVVDRLGLERETDAVVLSFEVGSAKPDPPIYRIALDRVGASPAEAVFVDDQTAYCDGAAVLGVRTFLIVREGPPPPEGFGDPGGHPVVRSLRELADLI